MAVARWRTVVETKAAITNQGFKTLTELQEHDKRVAAAVRHQYTEQRNANNRASKKFLTTAAVVIATVGAAAVLAPAAAAGGGSAAAAGGGIITTSNLSSAMAAAKAIKSIQDQNKQVRNSQSTQRISAGGSLAGLSTCGGLDQGNEFIFYVIASIFLIRYLYVKLV